ncbi:helix-turn-helix domain-containing protein [bacterium]|nr:helix-turn-helix domain-containing protein [bacterium]
MTAAQQNQDPVEGVRKRLLATYQKSLLSISEVAKELGVSETFVRDRTEDSRIPVVRLGDLVKVRIEVLAQLVVEGVD